MMQPSPSSIVLRWMEGILRHPKYSNSGYRLYKVLQDFPIPTSTEAMNTHNREYISYRTVMNTYMQYSDDAKHFPTSTILHRQATQWPSVSFPPEKTRTA